MGGGGRNLDTGNLLQSVGPKTVSAQREKMRRSQEEDPRATDAGWDTMGQYWDNLSRRADRLALRTPSYPGIKSQTIPWKDNSRPPTRIVRQRCFALLFASRSGWLPVVHETCSARVV
jgi:hypothetical protein